MGSSQCFNVTNWTYRNVISLRVLHNYLLQAPPTHAEIVKRRRTKSTTPTHMTVSWLLKSPLCCFLLFLMLDGDASYGILKIFLWMYIYWQQLQHYSFHQMASFISPGTNEIRKNIQCQEGPSEGRIANSRGMGEICLNKYLNFSTFISNIPGLCQSCF